jgi:predicted dehydrogenase
MIGSSCNYHTPLAVKVAETGLPLFLEKPVSISNQQVEALREAYAGREKSVVVSFPLRFTPLFKAAIEIVRSGELGTISQVQAINNVPYGWVYYGMPAFREYETSQGLWLQKATHDFDYLNQVLGRPTAVTAMMSRTVYGGDMPHDLSCSACDLSRTCPESPEGMELRGNHGNTVVGDHPCVFSEKIAHQDAGSAIVQYEGGVHAAYSQNFVSRRSAATRGATVTGYKATLSFDWYTQRLRLIDHHGDRQEEQEVKVTTGHMGGDEALLRNFVDVCRGHDESRSDLTAGLTSATMCLAARESVHRQAWAPILDVRNSEFPDPSLSIEPTPNDLEPLPVTD